MEKGLNGLGDSQGWLGESHEDGRELDELDEQLSEPDEFYYRLNELDEQLGKPDEVCRKLDELMEQLDGLSQPKGWLGPEGWLLSHPKTGTAETFGGRGCHV